MLVALLLVLLSAAFSAPAHAQNVIQNPSFTTDCAGVPCSWGANFNATISRDTTVFNTSPASLRITALTAAGVGSAFSCISLSPGAYTLSYSYNIDDARAIGARVSITYFEGQNCNPGDEFPDSTSVAAATEGGWQQATGNPVAPAGTVSALIVPSFICSTNPCLSGAFANFDDISLVAFPTTAATFRGLSATAASAGILVRWRTASETGTLGFHVYRQANGKRVRINMRLLSATGRGLYSLLDRKAPKAKTVRYWVQVVNLDGTRSWYGPARVPRN